MAVAERIREVADGSVAKHQWTRSQFDEMERAGFFADNYRTEHVDGEIYVMSVPGFAHMVAVRVLAEWLASILPSDFEVHVQGGADVRENSVSPDIMVISQPLETLKRRPRGEEIALIVEVSKTSSLYDRSIKRRIYGESGIAEYWLLDLESRTIEIATEPSPTGYRRVVTLAEGELVAPQFRPDSNWNFAEALTAD